METATGTTPANKRVRFDPTVRNGEEDKSPFNHAIGHVTSHSASLHPEIQDIVTKVSTDYLRLRRLADLKN